MIVPSRKKRATVGLFTRFSLAPGQLLNWFFRERKKRAQALCEALESRPFPHLKQSP